MLGHLVQTGYMLQVYVHIFKENTLMRQKSLKTWGSVWNTIQASHTHTMMHCSHTWESQLIWFSGYCDSFFISTSLYHKILCHDVSLQPLYLSNLVTAILTLNLIKNKCTCFFLPAETLSQSIKHIKNIVISKPQGHRARNLFFFLPGHTRFSSEDR